MTVVLREEPLRPLAKFVVPRSVMIVTALFSLLVALAVSVVGAYYYLHVHHGAGLTIAKVLPLPAVLVNGRVVWYVEVAETANALESEAQLNHAEAIERALLLEIREELMAQVAAELGVNVEADKLAFATALEAAVLASPEYQSGARARLERLQIKLDQGLPFYDLAVQYSEGASAAAGGDLGYVDPASLPEDLASTALTLSVGTISNIVATRASFWLAEAEDVIENDDGKSVWLRVIEVKKDLLGVIIDDEYARANVRQLLRF